MAAIAPAGRLGLLYHDKFTEKTLHHYGPMGTSIPEVIAEIANAIMSSAVRGCREVGRSMNQVRAGASKAA